MISLEALSSKLGLAATAAHIIGIRWAELTEGWDGTLPDFLSEEFFLRYYPEVKGPSVETLVPRVRAVVAQCRATPEAALYADLIHRGVFALTPIIESAKLPPPPFFGENAGVLQLLVAMSGIPLIERKYRDLGLPEHYAHDVLPWIGGTIAIYQHGHDGIPGHAHSQTHWIRNYVDGRLFRIGRLEYLMHNFISWMPLVFRADDGRLEVLVGPGGLLDAKGLAMPRSMADQEPNFPTFIEEDGPFVTGIPVGEDGHALVQERRTIDTRIFHPVCRPWSLMPSVHIPGGQRMPLDEVQASLREAKSFFRKYFHREVPMFACCSWILNPVWRKYLPDGNMAQMQRWLHAVPPALGTERYAGVFFVFGRDGVAPTELPARNRMQEAMQQAYREEGRLIAHGGFVLADEL